MLIKSFAINQQIADMWEGKPLRCPRWQIISNYSSCFMYNLINTRSFSTSSSKLKSFQGPHNLNIISLIVGSLLNSSSMEKVFNSKNGTIRIRLIFIKYSNNVEYLIKVHSILAQSGYCNTKRPRLYKYIGKKNKVFYLITFKTYSFTSFNWLGENNFKILLWENLYSLFTPLTLATIFISSNWAEEKIINIIHARFNVSFPVIELKELIKISHGLKLQYNIETRIKNHCGYTLGTLLIKNSSKAVFAEVVRPHILPSQYHLLRNYSLNLTFGRLVNTKRGLVTLSPNNYGVPVNCLKGLNLFSSQETRQPKLDRDQGIFIIFGGKLSKKKLAECTFSFRATSLNSFGFTFGILLHIDDLQVLIFIQKNLGFGKVKSGFKRPVAQFCARERFAAPP